MVAFNSFNQFAEDLMHGVHDFSSDVLKYALSNVAPDPAADAVFADITEISAGNGYSAGGATLSVTSSSQIAGAYKLIIPDISIVASGGSIGPFRYGILYNSTPVSPVSPLIGWWDLGISSTLLDTQTFLTDLSQTNGVLALSF